MSRCRKTLSLLRTSVPTHQPHRSFATGLSSIPSTSQSISNPSIPPRSQAVQTPMPIATSSRYTLDHPFWFDKPDPAVAALQFATDEELFQALLLPDPGSRGKGRAKAKAKQGDSGVLFDPSAAFLALRSRPTYTAFLQCVHSCLGTVYPRLKQAGESELLVSDLLLRYPDPRLLRDLLELEAHTTKSPPSDDDLLRPSLIASINSIIGWQVRRGGPKWQLSFRTHHLICRAMETLEDTSATVQAWHGMRIAAPTQSNQPDTGYLLLTFVTRIARKDPVAAFSMLHSLVRDEALPRNILLRNLGPHPKRRHMLVLGAVVKCCMSWGMEARSRKHAEELLEMALEGSGIHAAREAIELVLEVCKGAEAGKDVRGLEWCMEVFLRMARADSCPPIPGPLFDAWLDTRFSLPRQPGAAQQDSTPLDIWKSLPPHRRPSISATNILRLAQSPDVSSEILLGLFQKLPHLDPSTTLPIAIPMITLIAKRDMPLSEQRGLLNILLQHWSGTMVNLGGAQLVDLVRVLRADRARCSAIVRVYEARLLAHHARRGDISVREALAMVHSFLLIKDRERAEEWLSGVDLSEEVREGLWEMSLGNGDVRIGLRGMLRKRCSASEAKRILAGDLSLKMGSELAVVE
ncbi:uncharacterized protein MKK02DRAFT_43493 [Dioszegia hungarica]|uniref:Uncharacterized protein n=1 Tax=Dioszegia hungarica TaxID=4972 RepID=A0AA38HCK4_9TREE|nr:uncharacterized protein MKK02DRAFT_43493 [Dioszegia hungarica]KAI9637567.1 hypothetical protein MKK02DRAFT_43493 [Dioszegia hungarica]